MSHFTVHEGILISSHLRCTTDSQEGFFFLSLTFCLLRTGILFGNCLSLQGCYSFIPKTDDTSALTLIGSHRSLLFCRWGQSSRHDETCISLINLQGKINYTPWFFFFFVRSLAENGQLFRRIISIGEINNWTPENSSFLGSEAVSVGFLRPEANPSEILSVVYALTTCHIPGRLDSLPTERCEKFKFCNLKILNHIYLTAEQFFLHPHNNRTYRGIPNWTYSIRMLLKMDYWKPKHVELLNVMNKINHQILFILFDYIYIAI